MKTIPNQFSACNPLVSIITPAFNPMPYLPETIWSIQIQNYSPIEHIIIDGGSTDGTKEYLQNQPNLIWKSEPDRGQSQALNKGFRLAKGEIIGWLNADDTYNPGSIKKAVEFFGCHPYIDLIYSDLQIIDEKSQPISIKKGESFSIEKLLLKNMVTQPTIFIRRHVIESLLGVNEDLHYVMDREFWMRAGIQFKFEYIPDQIFANFRFCEGTKSFEEIPFFHKEWFITLNALENSTNKDDEEFLNKINIAKIIASEQYFYSFMVHEAHKGNRFQALKYFLRAISVDWRLIFQLSNWKLFCRVFIFDPFKKITT